MTRVQPAVGRQSMVHSVVDSFEILEVLLMGPSEGQ